MTNEGFSELLSPNDLSDSLVAGGLLEEIRDFSLLEGKRIGWNYPLDYCWIAKRVAESGVDADANVLDVGCGPGAIHGFLERTHGLSIVGIDRRRWDRDYVDFVGDVTDADFRRKTGLKDGSFDMVISASAFEHNAPDQHRRVVEDCYRLLKPGGHLVATIATSGRYRTTHVHDQWNLSRPKIEAYYGVRFRSFPYLQCWWQTRCCDMIASAYKKRYKKWGLRHPLFLSVGVHFIKSTSQNSC